MGGVRGGGQGPQGHTCTWRLFEAATVGKVWRATAREREKAAAAGDGMGRPKDGSAQALALASLALPLHARGASCCRGWSGPARPGGHACAAHACRTRAGERMAAAVAVAVGERDHRPRSSRSLVIKF